MADGISFSTSGSELTVTIKVGITDILARTDAVDKPNMALQRAYRAFGVSLNAKTNRELDAEAAAEKAAIDARIAQAKTMRPAGTL